MIDDPNSFGKQHRIFITAIVILLLICSFGNISSAAANTSATYMYSTYDERQPETLKPEKLKPEKLKLDALKKHFQERIVTIPLFGISGIPNGFSLLSMLSPLMFERDLWYPENMSKSAIVSSHLPVSMPAVDNAPCFQSVSLSNTANLSERICFTGTVTDDLRLKSIRAVVQTPTGSSFELLNTPISGCRIDLSRFCIDGIDDLHTVNKGGYKVILAVKDSANQVVSKTFFISAPLCFGCQQDMHGGQCVNFVRVSFGGRHDLMPGLCIYGDCGAYHAWEEWDLGYGKGSIPAKKSILVLDKGRLLFGHVAIVKDLQRNADNTYTLTVDESNWDRDELIDCGVRYTYFPKTSRAIREGSRKVYDVAGFIYGENVYN